ncbi:hypothetical protein PSTG_12963 [Puccinia striiformis f. sp. tritici PST-78]|uniref:Uncharacterized protein n=1 Tax=Puccinia striiformis f. sp. tritici PST-78 TaxID=1165861 RepID=A0A0L0V324_9BASI|nr:hypothetical protein PSTG_12963 [Puccinia striiformis f. sp. tritici PST-78]
MDPNWILILSNHSLIRLTQTNHSQKIRRHDKPPPSLEATRLSQVALSVAKLSRIFINKLSKRGMNMKGFPLYTEMCSVELMILSRLAREVVDSVDRISFNVERALTSNMDRLTEILEKPSISSLVLVNKHALPPMPDTINFHIQSYFKTWSAAWFTHFTSPFCILLAACR